MTDFLYPLDSYLKEFEAHVVGRRSEGVTLNRSAFYPGGGGQPSDTGELHGEDGTCWPVRELKRIDGEVVHVLDGDPPGQGSQVHGRLNWQRRYALMRTHSAMHILCGVVWRDYQAKVTGGNMEPGKGRLDFEFEHLDTGLVGEIEQKINSEVDAARDIRIDVLPRDKAFAIPDLIRTKVNLLPKHIHEVRIIEIVGLDLQADGGTHVANTREVGPLKIVGHKSKGRLNKRLVVALDQVKG